MAKIQLIIRDKDNTTIAGASLVMQCNFKNGEPWKSESQVADNSGVISLVVDNNLVRRFNWDTIVFDVRVKNKKLEYTFSRPEKISPGTYQINIVVQAPLQPDKPKPAPTPTPTPTPVPVPVPDPDLKVPNDIEEQNHQVSGHILQSTGHPAEGLTVVAFDRSVCEEKLLGSIKTKKDGSYQIIYYPENFIDPDKPSADLIVRVYQDYADDAVALVSSPLFLGANRDEVINLSIGDGTFMGLTLYELAEQNLETQLKGKFDCVDTTGIWYLVDKTGLSANVITQYINAHTLSQQLEIKRNVARTRMLLFALVRAGLASDLPTFARLSDRKIANTLERAIKDRWIPEFEYASLFTGLRKLRVGISLVDDKVAETLMSLAGLSTEQIASVYDTLLVNKEDNNNVLDLLSRKTGFGADTVEQLKNTVDLYQFVGRNLDIVEQLQSQQNIRDPQALTTLDESAWNAVLAPIAQELPPSLPGKDAEAKAANLATRLNGLVEKTYPGGFFAQRLLADQEMKSTPINGFLSQNPDFDFASETVRERLGEPASAAETERLEQLQAAESLFHVLPDDDRYGKFKLLNAAFDDSSAIAATSKSQFRLGFAESLGGVAIADSVYSQARHLQAKNVALNANLQILTSTVDSNKLTNPAAASGSQKVSSFPTMDALFGDVSAIACDHCQSATSPSAYLVDLLTYLQRATDDDGNDGLALLRGKLGVIEDFRRPDIELLELSCENSDTLVPCIDLLLEVFENAVTKQMDNVHQTVLSAEEIAARPEHTNFVAYERVVAAVYPWILPFNIDLQTSRAYLQQLGLPRHRLLTDLHKIADTQLAIGLAAAEYLGLSPLQTIIVSTPADKVPTLTTEKALGLYWGLLPAETLDDLKELEFILRKSGLDQETFEAVLAAEFVNPGGSVYIDANAQLNATSEEFYDRFHRFARLHLYSGLAIEDLDIALTSLDASQLEASVLILNLACIFRIADEAKLGVAEVTGWWTDTTLNSLDGFADSLGEDSVDAERFGELSGVEPTEPLLAWQFWHAWHEFQQSGLVVADVYNLLKIPLDGDVYSVTESTSILLEIQAALNTAALTTAGTTGGEVDLSVLPVEQKRLIIQDSIAAACSVEAALVAAFFDDFSEMPLASQPQIFVTLMGDDFSTDEIEGSQAAAQFSVLWKQLILAATLELEPADFSDITALAPSMGWLNPAGLSVDTEQPNTDFVALSSLYFHQQLNLQRFSGDTSLYRFMAEFEQYTIANGFDFAEFAAQTSAVSDWVEADLIWLVGADGFAFRDGADLLAASGLLRIENAIAMAESHDLSQEAIWSFADWTNVEAIRDSLESKYEASQWLDISAQLHNPLREQQRDALLYYLIPRVSALFATNFDAYDVYAFYLIDPEMSSCFITSRTKQAISSVQQYIQRILLNLEDTLKFADEDDVRQWEWRKNYRVWEANVKVFFFPENFLLPELRDDKSELFEVLESQLLQDEVRADTAQNALLEYCRGLHRIGNLEISAIYEDEDPENNGNTRELHVFSRTRAIPHDYYHCIRSENGLWSDWKEVKVDIAGNHLIPVKYNGRMYLFWPVFEEKLDSDNGDYKEAMAQAESDINAAKTLIDNNNKLIDDLTNLIAEFEDAAPPQDTLSEYYNVLLFGEDGDGGAKGQVEVYDKQYLDVLQEKDSLIKKYTYLDTTLNWSEHLITGGWSPKKVGESRLQTKIYNGYISNPEDVRLSIKSISPQLEIRLLGKDEFIPFGWEGIDVILYNEFGSFTLDICENKMIANSVESSFHEDTHFVDDTEWNANADVRVNQKWLTSDNPAPLYFIPEPEQRVKIIDNGLTGAKYCSVSPQEGLAQDLSVFAYEDSSRVFIVDRGSQNTLGMMEQDEPLLDNEYNPPNTASWDTTGRYDSLWSDANTIDTQVSSQVTDASVWDRYAPASVSNDGVTRSNTPFGGMTVETKPTEFLTDWGQNTSTPIQSTAAATLSFSEIKYDFTALYHPYTCTYIRQLSQHGIDGLYQPDKELGGDSLDLYRQQVSHEYFEAEYDPTDNVDADYPLEHIEFTHGAPYAVYNWELFFHAPMLVAKRLIQNQQFEEAQTWLHYIFNPTANDGSDSARYWRFRPFWLEQTEINNGDYTTVEQLAQFHSAEFDAQIAVWQDNPFNPYVISRLRTIAFMRNTVMTYLDNLLAWGDQLFRRDSIESINEAAQIYLLAAEILGPQPLKLPAITDPDPTATALDYINGTAAVTGASSATGASSNSSGATGLLGVLLSFCIPANDTLLAYWDTVADRLFKIRHCMNIDGVVRSLALYEPPIDPALLVKAAASGLSIADAVSGLSAPRPHYRFTFMLQKAHEFLGEVKNLGGALLSALGSQDAEELSQIRASHEVSMAKKILDVRKQQVEEIEHTLSGLNVSLFSAMHRRAHYQSLIDTGDLKQEIDEQKKLKAAHGWEQVSASLEAVSAVFFVIPNVKIGIPPEAEFGGTHLGSAVSAAARGMRIVSSQLSFEAGKLSRQASNIRRSQEWGLQLYTAERDLEKLNKDILASEIRKAIAEREIANQETQIANSEEAELFLQSKFTNKELYSWMVTQLSTLYFQAYQLAQELASAAEQCYQYELGVEAAEGSFIQFGHWDSLHKGLLVGEKLALDLRQMELSYLNKNKRKYELTKHVSLQQLSPEAWIQLRESGQCLLTIPEGLFALDYPGHFKRRIKSVSLSIPAITGPYTNLSCTLTLMQDWTRPSLDLDPETIEWNVVPQSIATSGAQNDTGMFQFDFRDERYLPFEGAGAISQWKLALPKPSLAQFDYYSISDVIFHLNYTAEEGGDTFKGDVEAELEEEIDQLAIGRTLVDPGSEEGLFQLLSMKHHFSDIWAMMLNVNQSSEFATVIDIKEEYFPYVFKGRSIELLRFDFIAVPKVAENISFDSEIFDLMTLSRLKSTSTEQLSLTVAQESSYSLPTASFDDLEQNEIGEWEVTLPSSLTEVSGELHDLLIICKYSVKGTN